MWDRSSKAKSAVIPSTALRPSATSFRKRAFTPTALVVPGRVFRTKKSSDASRCSLAASVMFAISASTRTASSIGLGWSPCFLRSSIWSR